MLNIKGFRKANKLKQEDIASYLGVTTSFISQIENGARDLPEPQLSKLLNNDFGWDVSLLRENVEPALKNSSPKDSVVLSEEAAVLLERINGLMKLLEEKERTIRILMQNLQNLAK